MNWDDPAARYELANRLGPDGYNEAFAKHIAASTVATVNGHAIRPVVSQRFGRIFMVGKTGTGFTTLARAQAFARRTL